jgi:hypothetical protein
MSSQADLERLYRRLLAFYPRAFRDEYEDEALTVLLEAAARDGRRRPGLADSANLLTHAVWMRLRPGSPGAVREVVWAIRLMLLCAALELVALITVVASEGSLQAAIARDAPGYATAHYHALAEAQVVPVVIGAPIAAAVCLWLAWANSRGRRWARIMLVAWFGLTSLSLLSGLADGALTYAPADAIAGFALWLAGLVAVLLTVSAPAGHYCAPRPAAG